MTNLNIPEVGAMFKTGPLEGPGEWKPLMLVDPTRPICPKCGKNVMSVVMRRATWTAATGWLSAPWSECCGVRVLEMAHA